MELTTKGTEWARMRAKDTVKLYWCNSAIDERALLALRANALFSVLPQSKGSTLAVKRNPTLIYTQLFIYCTFLTYDQSYNMNIWLSKVVIATTGNYWPISITVQLSWFFYSVKSWRFYLHGQINETKLRMKGQISLVPFPRCNGNHLSELIMQTGCMTTRFKNCATLGHEGCTVQWHKHAVNNITIKL